MKSVVKVGHWSGAELSLRFVVAWNELVDSYAQFKSMVQRWR